jgi:hypothetical protein
VAPASEMTIVPHAKQRPAAEAVEFPHLGQDIRGSLGSDYAPITMP